MVNLNIEHCQRCNKQQMHLAEFAPTSEGETLAFPTESRRGVLVGVENTFTYEVAACAHCRFIDLKLQFIDLLPEDDVWFTTGNVDNLTDEQFERFREMTVAETTWRSATARTAAIKDQLQRPRRVWWRN